MRNHDSDALRRDLQSDPVLRMMVECHVPLTRENYLALAYAGQPPETWGAELELELPEIFQAGDGGIEQETVQ